MTKAELIAEIARIIGTLGTNEGEFSELFEPVTAMEVLRKIDYLINKEY